ncbi:MAG TPA: ABC transporter permease, partial [Longimicrobiales bacterium]|nr:ABC transporter permease [Longimicrobiales bacterium]
MTELWQDVRYAVRSLRRTPGFAAVAVLTLALGIGANSAVFSVVNGVVLRPLEYREPGQLVAISSAFPGLGFDKFWISPPEFMELREWNRSFVSLGGYRTQQTSVGGGEAPERVTNGFVTADFFTTLGVQPLLGRAFSAEEDMPDAEPVAVLSYELWQRSYGGRREIVGENILVNGVSTRVTGVMPRGFDIDDEDVELWRPVQLDPANRQNRGSHFLNVIGRLKPGVTEAQAGAELDALVANWANLMPAQHVPNPEHHPFFLTGLQDSLVGSVRPALLLLGAVGFVLLIACANVGNLLLVRAETRQKEIAVRAAMGAGRGRLLRQFLTEGVVLALVGGVLGLALGHAGVRVLLATSPESIPRAADIAVDPRVLLFTLAVAVGTGLLFGLAPLFHLRPARLNGALREGGQRTTAGSGRHAVRRALVAAELALAVVLVVGAGLMLRSFAALQEVDPGFRPDGLVSFQLFLPAAAYPEASDQAAFHQRLFDRLEALPGVTSVAAMQGLPPRREVNANDTEFENVPGPPEGPPHNVDFYQTVTAGYLGTMGAQVVRGRGLEPADANAPVVLVNERLAQVFYPGQDPIGRRVRPAFGNDPPWLTIVGVVADVKQAGLEAETGTELYFMYEQGATLFGFAPRSMHVVARTRGDVTALLRAIPAEVRALDATLPVAQLRPMTDVLHTSMAQPRFLTLLLGIFAGVALALAAIGTYGVIAYSVLERQQEIGIRMALGARAAGVVGMVLGQALTVAAVGLVLGVAGALGLTRLLQALLFNVSATDFATFLVAPLLLAAVAAVASLVPALRAATVDPAQVLKG